MAMSSDSIFVPSLLPYLIMYDKQFTFHGFELHLQFIYNDEDLFHAILQTGSPTEPITLKSGSESSGGDSIGTVTVSEDFQQYALLVQGREVLTARFQPGERRGFPKSVNLRLSAFDDSPAKDLCSSLAVRNSDGNWCLDFDGRSAEPSRLNCIMVDPNDSEVAFYVRLVDSREINCDARAGLSPLCLFAFVVFLNICPF
jgi:hypothetical protein